jgi:hypothetical protein
MSKIVNSKGETVLDDPDEFPEGALIQYLKKNDIDYVFYNDPFEYLEDVWRGTDLCAMSLSEFLKEFPEVGKMNANDCNKLLVVDDYIKVIPANVQDSSEKSACDFYSKILQEITEEELYIIDTEE